MSIETLEKGIDTMSVDVDAVVEQQVVLSFGRKLFDGLPYIREEYRRQADGEYGKYPDGRVLAVPVDTIGEAEFAWPPNDGATEAMTQMFHDATVAGRVTMRHICSE